MPLPQPESGVWWWSVEMPLNYSGDGDNISNGFKGRFIIIIDVMSAACVYVAFVWLWSNLEQRFIAFAPQLILLCAINLWHRPDSRVTGNIRTTTSTTQRRRRKQIVKFG